MARAQKVSFMSIINELLELEQWNLMQNW